MAKSKKTTITVDRDDFSPELADKFTRLAAGYGIPRGKLLSRAIFLAACEIQRKDIVHQFLEEAKERDEAKGLSFDDDFALDTEEWLATIPGLTGIVR